MNGVCELNLGRRKELQRAKWAPTVLRAAV